MGKIVNLKNLALILILSFILLSPIFCYAATGNLKDAFKKGGPLDQVAGDKGAGYNINQTGPESMISKVITTALTFVGVIFLVLAIYGGYTWMIARGNEQEVEKAKNTLIAAVIGLVIVIAAYAVSWFVINSLSGAALKSGANKTLNGQEQEQSAPIKSDLPTFDPVPF